MRFLHRITLLTPESVELEFTLAGIGSRAFALTIDYNILLIGLGSFWVVFGIFASQLLNYLDGLNIDYSRAPAWLLAIAILISSLISAGYFVGFEVLWQGQTPGKRFAKIRVIREDGRPPGILQAALRALLRPVDDLLCLGVFLILLGRKEKRVGDWVAGTLVVQEERPQAQTTITISKTAEHLSTELPQLTNLSYLLPDDFMTVKAYLQQRSFMEPKSRSELSMKLARQAKALIDLQTIPPNLTSDQFLEALYLAYQHQFREQNLGE